MTQTFDLTEKQITQRAIAAGTATHILAYGGSRSGKTFGFCRCIAVRALSAPGSRHLISRLHNVDVRQSVMMDTWPTVMRLCFPGVPYQVNKSDQFAKFDNDAEIWFGGLDDKDRVDKILGKEYATVYVNESSQVSYPTVVTLRSRLAQGVEKINGKPLPLKAYYDLNPSGKSHWTYSEFIEGVIPGSRTPLPKGKRAWVQMNPEDNPYLRKEYLEELDAMPERERTRFKLGEYLSEVPGTLWPVQRLEETRVGKLPDMARVVVGVDPSGGGDSQGIIIAGKGVDGHCYILEDMTCNLSPAGWGRRAVEAYHKWRADLIVAERNFGGDMVEDNIKSADRRAAVKLVTASRGKHVRAEPVAALYEETPGRKALCHHYGRFPELEDEMSSFTTSGYQGSNSPDRADALVWAVTELMIDGSGYNLIGAMAS